MNQFIPGQYMVFLKKSDSGSSQDEKSISKSHHRWLNDRIRQEGKGTKNKVRSIFDIPGFIGYYGDFSDSVIQDIRNRPEVDYVRQNRIISLSKSEMEGVSTERRSKTRTRRSRIQYKKENIERNLNED